MPEGVNFARARWPGVLGQHQAADAFRLRAGMKLRNGEWASATDDVLAGYRLGVGVGRGPMLIDSLVGAGVRGDAAELLPTLATSPDSDADRAKELLATLQELGDVPGVSSFARFADLATVIALRQAGEEDGPEGLCTAYGELSRGELSQNLCRVPVAVIDWDEALRLVNRWWDVKPRSLRLTGRREAPPCAPRARKGVSIPQDRTALALLAALRDARGPGRARQRRAPRADASVGRGRRFAVHGRPCADHVERSPRETSARGSGRSRPQSNERRPDRFRPDSTSSTRGSTTTRFTLRVAHGAIGFSFTEVDQGTHSRQYPTRRTRPAFALGASTARVRA